MRTFVFALLALSLGTAACSSRGRTPRTPPPAARAVQAQPAPSVAGPTPPAPAAPADPHFGTPRDLGGLRVTPNEDGSIRIEGKDRWDGDASATYQSVDYLEPALPVLERSLTEAQVAGLRALVAELRAGTAAAH